VLIDNAADRIRALIPEMSRDAKIKALELAQKNCFAVGLTSVTDAGLPKADILLMDSLQQKGMLKIRILRKQILIISFPKGPCTPGDSQ